MGQKYYLFSGDAGADYTTLRGLLESMNIIPYPDTQFTKNGNLIRVKEKITLEYPVFFLSVEQTYEQGYDHNTYTIPCVVHNIHDSSTINTINIKADLHAALSNSDLIAKSWSMEEFMYDSGVYIMRPSHMLAFSGRDITVISSAEEFERAKVFYEKKKQEFSKGSGRMRDYRVVVSEYIIDPMLFHGKKFHIRAFINTIASHDGLIGCSISYQNAFILTAAEPYIKSDWNNKQIHDTHGSTTDGFYPFPECFPGNLDTIWPQLNQLIDSVKPLCFKHRPFSQAKFSQHVFGIDLMVTSAGKIKLIEINSGAALGNVDTRGTDYSCLYNNKFNMWLWNTGLYDICELGINSYALRTGLTYVTCGHAGSLYFPHLCKEMNALGIENAGHLDANDTAPDYVDVLLVSTTDTGIQKNIWHLKNTIENLFDVEYARELTDKARLHDNMKIYWRATAQTLDWNDFKYTSGRFIVRPSGHFWGRGKDIEIISNQEEYKKHKNKYDNIAKKHRVIVSKLLDDCLLFKGLKFHIRAFLLVHNYGGLTVKFAPFSKIHTAAKPYINSNFDNKEIHDSHGDSTDDDYWFPEDFPNQDLIAPIKMQMDQLADNLKNIYLSKKGIRGYPNNKTAYEVYGVDLMVTNSCKLILIEINDTPGIVCRHKDSKEAQEFYKKRALWEWDEILSKLIRAYLSE